MDTVFMMVSIILLFIFTKMKLDTRVKIVKASKDVPSWYIGKTGKLIKIARKPLSYQIELGHLWTVWVPPSSISEVKPHSVVLKFDIGDFAKVITGYGNKAEFRNKIGRIIGVESESEKQFFKISVDSLGDETFEHWELQRIEHRFEHKIYNCLVPGLRIKTNVHGMLIVLPITEDDYRLDGPKVMLWNKSWKCITTDSIIKMLETAECVYSKPPNADISDLNAIGEELVNRSTWKPF